MLHPEIEGMALVPICSHALSARPILIPKDLEVKIVARDFKGKGFIVFDGQVDIELKPKDEIFIRASKSSVRLIRTTHKNWSQALRTKLKMD